MIFIFDTGDFLVIQLTESLKSQLRYPLFKFQKCKFCSIVSQIKIQGLKSVSVTDLWQHMVL